ncbi:Holliday junction branch migration DNA helicase RuvB [Candidatus Dependentiae bacterium]|nr:MAG: Holliday junction branch migration DNA helicase RuvB [Candidatus Dependentiae bacterium]
MKKINQHDEFDVISLQEIPEDRQYDFCPKTFKDYLGQTEMKKKLRIYTQAAKMRNEPLDHLLLFGPPGLGKTTFAQVISHVMEVDIKICSGPMMERTGDLVAILSGLNSRDILFIDEIHRMPANVEEILYTAMEQFRVDVIIGQGVGAKSINLPLNQFTLIGATTKSGMLSAPLHSRFGIIERIDFYAEEDLRDIVLQSALFLDVSISVESALRIGACSRGTPRIAKKILRRVRDFAQVQNKNIITNELVQEALTFLGIDKDGLCKVDNMILRIIVDQFNGGPVGLETIASIIGEDGDTIEVVYEPFLMRKGYLEKTSRGRQIPAKKLPSLRSKFLGQKTVA